MPTDSRSLSDRAKRVAAYIPVGAELVAELEQERAARMDIPAHCAELRRHLEAGRPWLDPMTWLLVDELEAENARQREALHRICGFTDQDIEDPVTVKGMWRLVSRVHTVARAAIEPLAADEEDH